jgi:hypothetical protein
MSYNLGLNVVEVDGKATPSIQGAPTSVAAFIICAHKGAPGRVEQITNWTQFLDAFGGHMQGTYGAYAVRGFFDNGGSTAYVTRIVPAIGDDPAGAASVALIDADGKDVLTVGGGCLGLDNPGAWGNKLAVQVKANAAEPAAFDLVVEYDGKPVETWSKLDSTGKVGGTPENLINHDRRGSRYIRVTSRTGGNPAPTVGGEGDPASVALAGGSDGTFTDASLAAAAKDALSLFDIYQVQLVCCPETVDPVWATDALAYCQNRGDCMFVGHTPQGDLATAEAYGKSLRGDKVYGALYFPWILVADPKGTPIWIPPTGHVLGVYARTERERGIWKAPAGNAARLNGVLDVKQQITDTEHTLLVKEASVNAVRYISGQGIVIDSSRTLSTNPLWTYVNVRLLFNFVKSSLLNSLRWVVQEPNDETLWNKVKYNSVTPFLMGLWRRGAFGPGAPEQVFTVKCDAENNPPESLQQGIFTVEVYFYPSWPAETIVIEVGQQEGGGSASER